MFSKILIESYIFQNFFKKIASPWILDFSSSVYFLKNSCSNCFHEDALYTKKIRMLLRIFWEEDLSTELKQSVPYYVYLLMTKGVMIDIDCNLLVELKIILL